MAEYSCEQLRYRDGAVVLILKLSHTERAFYKPAIEAFADSVRGRLFAAACEEYECSEDRRKRYRFVPHTAEFRLSECPDHTDLLILRNSEILRHELHFWDGEVLKKRQRLQSSVKV